jgi:hypothetical protein
VKKLFNFFNIDFELIRSLLKKRVRKESAEKKGEDPVSVIMQIE